MKQGLPEIDKKKTDFAEKAVTQSCPSFERFAGDRDLVCLERIWNSSEGKNCVLMRK